MPSKPISERPALQVFFLCVKIVEKDDKEQFFQQHEAYHLVGLDHFFTKYFLKNNQLMRCRGSQDGTYDVYYFQGEVLDLIAHEGLLFKS